MEENEKLHKIRSEIEKAKQEKQHFCYGDRCRGSSQCNYQGDREQQFFHHGDPLHY